MPPPKAATPSKKLSTPSILKKHYNIHKNMSTYPKNLNPCIPYGHGILCAVLAGY